MDLTVWCGVRNALDYPLFFSYFKNLWVLLSFRSSSSGFKEGDFVMIETSWRPWMDDMESLLWMDSDVR